MIPKRRLVSYGPKTQSPERNFWIQRPEAKNPPKRPLLSAETGKVENWRQDPTRRNGLFSIDDGFRGSRRLDGGDDLDQNCMLPTQSSNQSPNLEPGTEFFAAETGAQNPPFRLLETGIETRRDSKSPRSGGISATKHKRGLGLSLVGVVWR